MGERGRDGRRSAAQWRALVHAYEGSGLSQREFCEQRGAALSTFCYWRRRVRQDAHARAVSPMLAPALELVAVRVLAERPAPAVGGATGVAVIAGAGVRIEVASDFDAATLRCVVATLVERT